MVLPGYFDAMGITLVSGRDVSLADDEELLDLLAENPFPDDPPRFLRTPFASYRFAPPGGDDWWTAEPLGEFCPTVTLRDGRLVAVRS